MTEHAWLERIAASPDDDNLRLEYAVWLEKRKKLRRAEYLRAVCESRRLHELCNQTEPYDQALRSAGYDAAIRADALRERLSPRWVVSVDRCFAIPKDICEDGRRAAEAILNFLVQEQLTDSAEVPVFFSPADWKEQHREILFGEKALLIVLHTHGALEQCFDVQAAEDKTLPDRIEKTLEQSGFCSDLCSAEHSAIYRIGEFPHFSIGFDIP